MGNVLGLSGNETKFGFLGNLIGKTWNFEFVAVSKMMNGQRNFALRVGPWSCFELGAQLANARVGSTS